MTGEVGGVYSPPSQLLPYPGSGRFVLSFAPKLECNNSTQKITQALVSLNSWDCNSNISYNAAEV